MLQKKIDRILSGTSTIPLGLYECPEPYKRMIAPDLLPYFARTGRFLYYKETSCNSEIIKNKLTSVAGSPLGLYNANTPTALDSLREGARGLSTISANFYPEMYLTLYQGVKNTTSSAETVRLQQHLSIMDAVTRIKYPLSAKLFLKMRGLKLETYTRINVPPLSFEEKKMLEALFDHFNQIKEEFKSLTDV
jgi:4-hydroxy-tetrahydrodipicolinate synthase